MTINDFVKGFGDTQMSDLLIILVAFLIMLAVAPLVNSLSHTIVSWIFDSIENVAKWILAFLRRRLSRD